MRSLLRWKYFFLVIPPFLCSELIFAQSFRGTVVAKGSKTPLPYANVYLPGTEKQSYIGTYTNQTGWFELYKPTYSKQDTVHISSIGFKTKTFLLKGLPDTLWLEEAVAHLSDIVIRAKTAEEFLKECIKKIPLNYKNALFLNHGVGWMVLKEGNKCKRLIESRIALTQEHRSQTVNTTIFYDSVNELQPDSSIAIMPEYAKLESHLYFDLIRSGPSILDTSYLASWNINFSYDDSLTTNGTIILNAKSKGNFNDYKLYINESDLGIVKIEYSYRWTGQDLSRNAISSSTSLASHHSVDSLSYLISKVNGIIYYENTFDKYNLKYLRSDIDYRRVSNRNSLVLPIRIQDFTLFTEFQVIHSKKYRIGDKSLLDDLNRPFKIPKVVPVNGKEYYDAKRRLQR